MRALQESHTDLALLDIRMPGVDGMEVLKFIHMNHPNVKVVMLTGFANLKYAMDSNKYGAVDFIPKPFQMQDVRATVARILGE